MRCNTVHDLMDAFVDGELGPMNSLRLRHHMASCSACSRLLDEVRRVSEAAGQWRRSPAPPEWRERMSALHPRPGPRVVAPRTQSPRRPVLVVAVAAVGVVGLITICWPGRAPVSPRREQVARSVPGQHSTRAVGLTPRPSAPGSRVEPPSRRAATVPSPLLADRGRPSGPARVVSPGHKAPTRVAGGASKGHDGASDQPDDLVALNDATWAPESYPQSMDASFISLPRPVVAASDSPEGRSLIARVLRDYRQDLCVNDKRLIRKIDLWMPRGELQDLVGQLQAETGISFSVSGDLANLKLCVIVKQQPLRDVMAQVVKLFNLEWIREGQGPAYRYTLSQSLEQKVAGMTEVASIDAVVAGMKRVTRLAASSDADLERRRAELQDLIARPKAGADIESLSYEQYVCASLIGGGYRAVVEAFELLSPRELADLANGRQVQLCHRPEGDGDNLPLPLVEKWLSGEVLRRSQSPVPPDAVASKLTLTFQYNLRRTGTNRLELYAGAQAHYPVDPKDSAVVQGGRRSGNFFMGSVLLSLSPVTASPAAVWRRTVDTKAYPWLAGKVSCAPGALRPKSPSLTQTAPPRPRPERIEAPSFYIELSRAAGKSVIAEYGTRVYLRAPFVAADQPLRDLLDSACGTMAADWQADGSFVRIRRRSFLLEQANEVPRQALLRLAAAIDRQGYAGLDELASMTPPLVADDAYRQLTDGIEWLYGGGTQWRATYGHRLFRLYSQLTPAQRLKAVTAGGLPASELTPEQRSFVRTQFTDGQVPHWSAGPDNAGRAPEFGAPGTDIWDLSDSDYAEGHFWIRLMPPGLYEWTDRTKTPNQYPPPFPPDITAQTWAQAEAQMESVMRARGASEAEIRSQKPYVYDPPRSQYPIVVSRLEFGKKYIREHGDGSSFNPVTLRRVAGPKPAGPPNQG